MSSSVSGGRESPARQDHLHTRRTIMAESTTETRLRSLGFELPPAPKPAGAYLTVIRTGNLVITAGQLPWKDGKLLHAGKLGTQLTVEQGYEAARQAGLNALAQIKQAVGDLDKVKQILRLEGY